jgi:regulator of protease activity HflC (stomatin/prohibitin superfamily)
MTPADPHPPGELQEIPLPAPSGRRLAPLIGLAAVGAVVLFVLAINASVGKGGSRSGLWVGAVVLSAITYSGIRGLAKVAPGDALVVQLLGRYIGSVREPGLWVVNPYASKRQISTRIRTSETAVLKVNDVDGMPIEIAMAANWRIGDTARAVFSVDDFGFFFGRQCEMALRHVAASHQYQPHGEGGPSLSTSPAAIADQLAADVARRVEPAGIEVIECQIIRLAYAQEIAPAMLRRQQAAAVVEARQQIVEGAVGMVELALHRLDEEEVVDLDEERKAAMVSNLLVVLCSDHATQPVVNTGSLYH